MILFLEYESLEKEKNRIKPFCHRKKKLLKSPFDLIENLFWLLSKKYQQAMQTI